MAKKKEQAPKEQAQQTPETNGTAAEAEQVPEIPETVTLTRDEFDQVKNRIDALQKDKDDTVAMAQRLQADFDNYRKRNAAIRMDSLEEGTRELIRSLLPVLDNFDRALDNSEAADQGWVDGVRLVHKQFMGILEKTASQRSRLKARSTQICMRQLCRRKPRVCKAAKSSLFCKKDIK